MGKARAKKHTSQRINPTGMPSNRDVAEESELEEGNVKSSVDELPDMLQGAGVEERECAACIMANVAKDQASCESLLNASVIRAAAPLLLDKNLAVRHSIAGALRNISAINHDAGCALIDFDIMTPLVRLLKEYNTPWQPSGSERKIDSKAEVFYEAVQLLWNLCESSDTAVSIFNQQKLWTVLLPCLDFDKYGTKIATAVGHCLHAVSEDNVVLAEIMSDFKAGLSILQTPSQEPGLVLLQVLSAGILINVSEAQGAPLAPFVVPIISVLGKALSLPVLENTRALAEKVAELSASAKERNVDADSVEEKERACERTLALVLDSLMAKQTALEILSNLCCGEDGGSKDDEYEDVSDDSSDGFDGGMDTDDTSAILPLNVSCEFHEAVVGQNMIFKVMNHASRLDKEISCCLKEHQFSAVVLRRVHAVRCRALLCIGNLAQTLEPDDFGGNCGLVTTWSRLAQLAFALMDFEDLELLEASTSACRSVFQVLATAAAKRGAGVTPALPDLSDEKLQVLTRLGLECSEPAVRVNVTRIVATLGCLLAAQQPNVLKKVGQYLLEVASKDSDIVVVTEALDATFDVFGEDTTDAVAMEIDLVTKLRQLLPAFKSKVNQAKKTLGKHYPVVMTAKTNLIRFIKYKAQKRSTQNGSGGH